MATSAQPPSQSATVRAVAARWAEDRVQVIADEMFEHISSGIAGVREDAEFARLTRDTALAVVELILSMMKHGIPAERAEAPVVGIEHARAVADRGGPIEDLLRFYRLGHARFTQKWTDAIMELAYDPADLVGAIREMDEFVFAFVDRISAGVSAAYIEERERLHRRVAAERRDLTRAILDGRPVEVSAAEMALGHSLRGRQLAFICWTDGGIGGLDRAAAALQDVLGARRPLVLSDERTLSGWFAVDRAIPERMTALTVATAAAAPEVHVGLGPVLPGIDGFRRSRLCAERVRRIVTRAGRAAPTLTFWPDVALADALTVDQVAAREIVRAELGALAKPGEQFTTLRETARTFVLHGFSYSSVASLLNIHRNTALQRVRKAETLRGTPLHERPGELLAALSIIDAMGCGILDDSAVC